MIILLLESVEELLNHVSCYTSTVCTGCLECGCHHQWKAQVR